MNLGQIRTLVQNFVGDPDGTRFSGKYDDAINRAQEQFCLETRALWKDATWSHAANDADEALPADMMWEDWVSYGGVKLAPITRYELLQKSGDDWTDDEADLPTHYVIDMEQAVKEIVLYPIPQTAKTLAMRYFPLPASVSSDSDVPLNSSSLMVQFHVGIAAYAAWLILLYETVTPEIQAKRRDLLDIWNDTTDKATSLFKNTVSAGLKIRGTRIYR